MFKWLIDNVDGHWNYIKEEYLKLKNNNKDINNHSFQLFYEAVSNVYNRF